MNLMTWNERLRMPSPAPQPQALAADSQRLYMGSWQTHRLYTMDSRSGAVLEETPCPGGPVGAVCAGGDVLMICSEAEDSRFIRRFVPGKGFAADAIPCPDDTGSFLAYDGTSLWLSQRYNKRVLQLDDAYEPVREIAVGVEIIGIAWAAGTLYLSTWLGAKSGGCRLRRWNDSGAPEEIAAVPFAGISLAHDGTQFWTNDFKGNAQVAFMPDTPQISAG